METEARGLRQEESVLRSSILNSQEELDGASRNLSELESRLKAEEDRVAAALRAIADYREGTARQEGHIKSLQSAISSAAAEINRLDSALEEAKTRVEIARKEFAEL